MNIKLQDIDALHRELLGFIEYECWICGGRSALQVAHIVTRKALSTRWDFGPHGNCHMLCAKCHEHSHTVDTEFYERQYAKRFGESALECLKLRSKHVFSQPLREIKQQLATKLQSMKGDTHG